MKQWKKQLSTALAAGMCALVPVTALADTGSPVVLSGEVVSISDCKVTVTVTDQNNSALEGAAVTVDKRTLTTGHNGTVEFEGFDLGETHQIEASRIGYSSNSLEYHVTEDEGEVTLMLRRRSSGGGGNSSKPSSAAKPSGGYGPGNPAPSQEPADQTVPGGTAEQPPSSPVRPETADGSTAAVDVPARQTLPSGHEENPQAGEAGGGQAPVQGQPIHISSPYGVNAVQIQDPVVGESIEKNAMVVVELTAPDGKQVEVSLPPFTDHDKSLYGSSELWVMSGENGVELVIQVPDRPDGKSEAYVPHNYSEAAVQWPADIRVVIQGTDQELLLPSGLFIHETYGRLDFGVEHDIETGAVSLLYTLKGSHAEQSLTAPKAAFDYASEHKLPLKARIYNPEDQEELWYEWSFAPQNMDRQNAVDTNLYISPELPDGDGLGNYLWWRHSQPLSITHHGPLPGAATLRIRDQFGFGENEKVDFLTFDEDAGRDVLYRDLSFDEDGFVTIGEMTHCSSYALTGNLWWWVIAAPAALLVLLLGTVWLVWRKRHEETR